MSARIVQLVESGFVVGVHGDEVDKAVLLALAGLASDDGQVWLADEGRGVKINIPKLLSVQPNRAARRAAKRGAPS